MHADALPQCRTSGDASCTVGRAPRSDLGRLGVLTAGHSRSDGQGWPSGPIFDYPGYERSALVRHPDDKHVRLAGVGALHALPADVDAVVSLCRSAPNRRGQKGVELTDNVEMWLVASGKPAKNPNSAYVLHDAVDAVKAIAEGRTVLLHCVQAQSYAHVAALHGPGSLAARPAS